LQHENTASRSVEQHADLAGIHAHLAATDFDARQRRHVAALFRDLVFGLEICPGADGKRERHGDDESETTLHEAAPVEDDGMMHTNSELSRNRPALSPNPRAAA